MAKLKVYRTPIGFHDAYVAAPSQKAALQAWGSDADLFARGIAEVVTDEALTAAPLAAPGTVIRTLRGTADEQIAAAKMPDRPAVRAREDRDQAPSDKKRSARANPPPKPKKRAPPPDRHALDTAEQALADARVRHAEEDREWRKRRDDLDAERRRLDRAHEAECDRLSQDEVDARRDYDRARTAWQADD